MQREVVAVFCYGQTDCLDATLSSMVKKNDGDLYLFRRMHEMVKLVGQKNKPSFLIVIQLEKENLHLGLVPNKFI
jgi:hypothetical protein